MSLCRFLLPGLLAAALPLAGFAQTEAPAPAAPRFFVGLGIYQLPQSSLMFTGFAPVVPTFGVQLRPRLAVQASAAFRSTHHAYEYSATYYDVSGGAPGQYYDYTRYGSSRNRSLAVPVLARYTLTRRQRHRFQADLLGGFTWMHQAYHSEQRLVDHVRATDTTSTYDQTYNSLYVTLGPSLRYRVWKGLELTGDLTYNLRVGGSLGRSYRGIEGNLAAGLRYRFGQ